MADVDGLKIAKDYKVDVPFANQGDFHVKGAGSLDWGMKKHMSNIFNPESGNTVMFAFDHGYFMGSTAGLERLDLLLPKLAPYVDCFMGTRGAIRTCVAPETAKSIALRVTSGSSMLQDDLSHEVVAVDIEDAIRMNADCMAVQTFPLFISKFHSFPVIISGPVLVAEPDAEGLVRRALRLRNMGLKFNRINSCACHRINKCVCLPQTAVMILGYFRNNIYFVLCNAFRKPFTDFHTRFTFLPVIALLFYK